MPILRTVTLGCKVNQYETQYVREGLLRLGYRDAAEGQCADLCVVNTCTVTQEGDYKSRKVIRALARQNPDAQIIVMGCYATRAPDELAELPGVTEVLTDKRRLPDWLARRGLADVPRGIGSFVWRHRAWVKVQDGCQTGCSYCIVPQVRPTLWSRPVQEVLEEIQRLTHAGYREIVLTGIHLGHYGLDQPRQPGDDRMDLARLIRRILALEGHFRLRISSLEAAELTPELITLMVDHPQRICPHLHLPLQSGSDQILGQMRRRYRSDDFADKCRDVWRHLPDAAITTDVMVGFPAESEADFQATCRIVEQLGLAKLHVFRYSRRRGTLAAAMDHQLPHGVKHHRAAELGRISRRLHRQYLERMVGRRLQVLVESNSPLKNGIWRGQREEASTLLGISGNYVAVELPAAIAKQGQIAWVTAAKVVGDRMVVGGS